MEYFNVLRTIQLDSFNGYTERRRNVGAVDANVSGSIPRRHGPFHDELSRTG